MFYCFDHDLVTDNLEAVAREIKINIPLGLDDSYTTEAVECTLDADGELYWQENSPHYTLTLYGHDRSVEIEGPNKYALKPITRQVQKCRTGAALEEHINGIILAEKIANENKAAAANNICAFGVLADKPSRRIVLDNQFARVEA
jgi:hypothetical protein